MFLSIIHSRLDLTIIKYKSDNRLNTINLIKKYISILYADIVGIVNKQGSWKNLKGFNP